MERRQLLATIFKGIATGIVFGRSAVAQDDLDPVRLMPDTHKVIFENSFVRVVEGRVPAGGREIKHRHPHNVQNVSGRCPRRLAASLPRQVQSRFLDWARPHRTGRKLANPDVR